MLVVWVGGGQLEQLPVQPAWPVGELCKPEGGRVRFWSNMSLLSFSPFSPALLQNTSNCEIV